MESPVKSVSPRYSLYLLGGACFGGGILHLLREGRWFGTILETALICGVSTLILYTGYRLSDRPISRSGQQQAVVLSIAFTGVFMVLALAIWTTQYVEGEQVETSFLLLLAASLGGAIGSRSSLSAVQSKEQHTQAQELAKLLKINQRVLRHNLRNELSIALGHLELIETADDPADAAPSIDTIRQHLESLTETSDRAQRIVSIWETDTTQEFDLATLLRERVGSLEDEHGTVSVTVDCPDECHVTAHPELPMAIDEALQNAVTHNSADISITTTLTCEDGTAVLEVADTGEGIPETDRDALRRPEETELSHSEGLGLWTIYWIVRKSGGRISLTDSNGATVRIVLPMNSQTWLPF